MTIGIDTTAEDETALVAALRAGDEEAFSALVRRHHSALRRVVRRYVPTDALADEVVQDAWLAVIKGLDRFEERASLKTWIFHIATNLAKTRGIRERRSVPFSGLAGNEPEDAAPAVAADRFQRDGEAWPGHWAVPPRPWEDPDRRAQSLEAREVLRAAIGGLPALHQAVVTLRDVEGLPAEEVCALLELSAGNQRVILHRARSRLRASLEPYMES